MKRLRFDGHSLNTLRYYAWCDKARGRRSDMVHIAKAVARNMRVDKAHPVYSIVSPK